MGGIEGTQSPPPPSTFRKEHEDPQKVVTHFNRPTIDLNFPRGPQTFQNNTEKWENSYLFSPDSINNYAANPDGAEKLVKQLINLTNTSLTSIKVPNTMQHHIEIYLGATAGMRLLR